METYKLDEERLSSPVPHKMLAAVKRARREKFFNRTRERERERRGEILPRTINRRNKGPPAHVLVQMTEEKKRWDKLSRHVSEVGVVAKAKRILGHKLKDPEAWKKEIGKPADGKRLARMEMEVRMENLRRRQNASDSDSEA